MYSRLQVSEIDLRQVIDGLLVEFSWKHANWKVSQLQNTHRILWNVICEISFQEVKTQLFYCYLCLQVIQVYFHDLLKVHFSPKACCLRRLRQKYLIEMTHIHRVCERLDRWTWNVCVLTWKQKSQIVCETWWVLDHGVIVLGSGWIKGDYELLYVLSVVHISQDSQAAVLRLQAWTFPQEPDSFLSWFILWVFLNQITWFNHNYNYF